MKLDDIIKEIVNRNRDFVEKHDRGYFAPYMTSQQPYITLVSCSDSRVQPDVILKNPVNKIFEIENIGNQIATCEGSVDYGVLHLKTPVLLILGHSDCGALKAFMKGYENIEDPIKNELNNLKPAGLSRDSDDVNFEENLLRNIQKNVDYQVEFAAEKYKDLISSRELVVIGAFYDFKNDFSKGCGRILILNVNGERDKNKIKRLPVFEHISKESIDILIDRI